MTETAFYLLHGIKMTFTKTPESSGEEVVFAAGTSGVHKCQRRRTGSC